VPTREENRARLVEFLLACFSAEELRRLLRYLPGGHRLENRLPGANASAAETASAVVAALDALDYLGGREFWDALKRERERRVGEIEALQRVFLVDAPTGDAAKAPVAGDGPRFDVVKILLVSASPIEGAALAVDEEFAAILGRLRHRTNLEIVQRTAVTFDRLSAALNDHAPHILHISSHGEAGALMFQPATPGAAMQRVPKLALIRLLRALGQNLRLVVFNACDSATMAAELVAGPPSSLEWTIGMNEPIVDEDAIDFSVAFYDSLAAGRPIGVAFEAALARLLLNLPEGAEADPSDDIPQLLGKDLEKAGKYRLVE
jgi:CHAT domain